MKEYKICRYNGEERTELCTGKGDVPPYERKEGQLVGEELAFQATEPLIASMNATNPGWLVVEDGNDVLKIVNSPQSDDVEAPFTYYLTLEYWGPTIT